MNFLLFSPEMRVVYVVDTLESGVWVVSAGCVSLLEFMVSLGFIVSCEVLDGGIHSMGLGVYMPVEVWVWDLEFECGTWGLSVRLGV